MTDMWFTSYMARNAKAIAANAPVYFYYFAFKGEFEKPDPTVDELNFTSIYDTIL